MSFVVEAFNRLLAVLYRFVPKSLRDAGATVIFSAAFRIIR
ncbi:MAG TPA: hypothetical protein VK639_14690 [Terriglobales bacterium]|nr:hypothetical protein [Terriglobales bacterium]